MALFKVFRGKRTDLDQVNKTDGHAYFCTDDGSFWIDYTDEEGQLKRKQVNEEDLKSKSSTINLENGVEIGTIEIKDIEQESYTIPGGIASGVGAIALTGQRGDKDPSTLDPTEDRISEASGLQSFVQGPGNLAAGDWSFVTGKDNTVYGNRAFVSGGANKIQKKDTNGNLLEEKTNVGRFNAIFGNNNTFTSTNSLREANLIAGGSNIVDTERSIVVGYNNNVKGSFDAVFGQGNIADANRSIIGGYLNTVNGGGHLVNGEGNTAGGIDNFTTGANNTNEGWYSATIGKHLIVGKGNTTQTVLGQYNNNKNNTILEIGWGSEEAPKNVFEVYKDGVVKIGTETASTQEWVKNYIPQNFSVGISNYVNGDYCFVAGHTNKIGENIIPGETYSAKVSGGVALNYSFVDADYAFAANYGANAKYQNSAAFGYWTKTGTRNQTVLGSYNAAKSTTAFEVGNGSASERKNAFEVLKAGGFNSYGDSTIDGNLLVNGVSFNNKLDKIETAITSTTTLRSYIINRDGSQGIEDVAYNPDGWAIARYNGGGQLSTVTPTSDNHCVNKKYIDGKLPSGIATSSKKYTDTDSYSSRLICNGIYDLVEKETAIVEKVEGNTAVVENIFENTKFKGVQLSGKNIAYTLEDRTLITVDKNSDLTVADWHFRENGFYLGTSGNDRVYDNKINSYSFDGNSLSASCVSSFYGIGFPIKVKGGELITISFENLSANTRISFREFIDSTTPNGSQSARATSPFSIQLGASTEWLLLTVQPTAANVDISVSNIQIEYGNTATEFEPYTQKDTEFTFDDYIELGKYDYLLPQENKIVRKTKEFILDGSNVDWMNPNMIGAKIEDFDVESGKDGIIMTGIYDTFVEDTFDHEWKSNEYTIYNGNYIAIGKLHADLREIQEYLNANPIKLIYKSTEEIVENIDCPKLYTVKNGINEVLVCDNTEVLPTITTTYKIIENPNYVPTVSYVQNELATKLDKLGGVITGDLVIEGKTNLALGALVSKKGDTTYGLTYDGESFKLGEGILGENGFTFNEGEGLPIALRSDSSKLTDGHLVSWNSGSNSLVDSGVSVSDIKENIGYKYGITPHTNNQGKNSNKISFVTAATWNSYIVYLTMRNSEGGYFLSQVFCCNGVGTVSGNNNEELIILYDESTKTYTIQGPQVINTDGWYDNTITVASVLKIG